MTGIINVDIETFTKTIMDNQMQPDSEYRENGVWITELTNSALQLSSNIVSGGFNYGLEC